MELIKLESESDVCNKKVICIGRSTEYLKELCAQYHVLDNIMAIVEDTAYNKGILYFCGKEIPVYHLKFLERADLLNSVLLITSDYFNEYFEKIRELLDGKKDVNNIYFFANKETEYELLYRKKYEASSLEKIIVFRSGPHASQYVVGMDFSDNARALFEYALSIGLNEEYELIWIVKSPDMFMKYQKYQNVSFLPFEGSASDNSILRDSYYRVLCLAKYFFFTDAYGFVRNCRKDQVRVQLWHGCGYKKRLNTVSCKTRYDYMTVTSPLYAGLHAREFGLEDGQMLITGCAKTDWLFQFSPEILELLHIPAADKYIFWLPTYRFSEKKMNKPIDGELMEETGLPLIACLQELEHINSKLMEKNMVLVIKLHPFQDPAVVCVGTFSNIIILENELLINNDIQVNQILAAADALISDYSSAAVDYLILNRPMAFLVDDVDSYSDSRGYIFEDILKWLPGKKVFDMNGLCEFLDDIGAGYDVMGKERARLREKMHQYKDGNNCRRILEALKIKNINVSDVL